MASLAWTATVIITALAGAAKAGVSTIGLLLVGVVGVILLLVVAAFGLLAPGRN